MAEDSGCSLMVMKSLKLKKKRCSGARVEEGICMYGYIVEETLTLAVLCFETFSQLGFLGEAACPSGLASI